jgi:heme o synthase
MSLTPELPAPALALSRGAAHGLARAADYVALTRPRVLSLVLFTAPPAMLMGHERWPGLATLAGVVAGAAMLGGGCGAINASIERDRDAVMARTCQRPLPTGRLERGQALGFGIAISVLGLLVLLAVGGWLSALIGALTLVHYVGVYTLWLKPLTPQNIVLGGAAGATAPLIADAAVDGRLGPWGWVLFGIIFLWTPPHFWAIALYRKPEYAAAGFPMLPCVVGDSATRRQMLAYAVVLVLFSILPWLGGALGPFYATVALGVGAWFIGSILRSIRLASTAQDRRVFFVSIQYLALLFAAMLVDLALR